MGHCKLYYSIQIIMVRHMVEANNNSEAEFEPHSLSQFHERPFLCLVVILRNTIFVKTSSVPLHCNKMGKENVCIVLILQLNFFSGTPPPVGSGCLKVSSFSFEFLLTTFG